MRMTTEEAFIKVLQRHGIEHAFGIIGSAMMPVSDLFPRAGHHLLGLRARDQRRASCATATARATGKMAMAIAQNGPGVTGFVTAMKTAYWNHTPMLLVTPQAANKTMGQGGFQEVPQMALFQRHGLLSGGGARSLAHRRSAQPRDRKAERAVGAGADQRAARFLDPGRSTSSCRAIVRLRAARRAARRRSPRPRELLSEAKFPVILSGAGVVLGGAIPQTCRAGRAARRAGLLGYQHNDSFPGCHPPRRRAARLQRLEGGDGADRQGRRRARARHAAQSVLDPAGLRHRLLAEERRRSSRSTSTPTASA